MEALAAAARRVWNCVAHTFLFLATWQWLGGPVDMGVVRECIERVVQQQRPPEVHFRGRPEFHWRAGALATWIFPVQAFDRCRSGRRRDIGNTSSRAIAAPRLVFRVFQTNLLYAGNKGQL